MRSDYTVIDVDPDLLPQVLRELFAMSTDPNFVEVTDAEKGRVILAHPDLAEAWYQKAVAKQIEEAAEAIKFEEVLKQDDEVVASAINEASNIASTSTPEDVPVKRGPGRPRKVVFASASNGEEPQ
jgi:hypothetical protein